MNENYRRLGLIKTKSYITSDSKCVSILQLICNDKDYLQAADRMIVESEFSRASKGDA